MVAPTVEQYVPLKHVLRPELRGEGANVTRGHGKQAETEVILVFG